ncbi:MAG: dihydroorotate dehydrogenase-like protein [Planctomycetes bacterium]|nr:dihydroorotate dehydrogenase-like protein [Planctomycetota bacterium]
MHADLTTRYLGLTLRNPLVVSACHLTSEISLLQRLEQAGAAAAVLPSLFQEQIIQEELKVRRPSTNSAPVPPPESCCPPELDDYNAGPDSYLLKIEAAKRAVSIPIVGSLNGYSTGGWSRYARLIQDAGADALELNIHFIPTSIDETAQRVEAGYLELVHDVRDAVSIPLAVKMGPYFSSIPNMASQFVNAGVAGLVLFNRFLEPDIDLRKLELTPRLLLSSRDALRLSLRWITILRPQLPCSLAATSGIHFAEDVIKAVLAGADVAMMASALIRHGPDWLQTVLSEVQHWMASQGYQSVEQMRGSVSHPRGHQANYERALYMQAVTTFSSKALTP